MSYWKEAWKTIPDDIDTISSHSFNKRKEALLLQHLPKNAKVLEVGCGRLCRLTHTIATNGVPHGR